MLADAERAVGRDAPRELERDLVFSPHWTDPRRFVRLPREVEGLALTLEREAQDRLAEADPARGMRLLRHEIVALGGVAHRQHVIGEPRGLAPRGRQARVALDLRLVGAHLDPPHA